MSDAYDMIDRFLRNNLGSDDDYAEYSKALDSLCFAQPAQAGHVPEASCGECGKKASDGWALYCVACMEEAGLPAQAVPMTDQEILDAAEAIKAKRVETAVKNTLSRVGSKCSQCGGVMGTDHNGYHLFNRCQSCSYVPMFMQDGSEFPPPPIVGKEGA